MRYFHFLTIAFAAMGAATEASAEPSLETIAIEIPHGGPTFPGGDRAQAVNTHCLICHSAEMVLLQPALPREEWEKEVAKMRKVYGAPVEDKDVPAIVEYLVALKPTN